MDAYLVKADLRVARIAANQHGVVTYAQLIRAGLTRTMIAGRVRRGVLHRLHRGVYAVGHTNLGREGEWIAAVFACGDRAVLSHESAAVLWRLASTCPPSAHVTVRGTSGRRKRAGIRLHYSTTLGLRDTTRRFSIPTTTRERTLRDMGWGPEPTRSHLEREFLRLLRSGGLPQPEVNARVGPYEVDFVWRRERLLAELDGYEFHSSRASFESDRRRDRELQRLGYVVLRFTYREVTGQPAAVIASLLAHLRGAA